MRPVFYLLLAFIWGCGASAASQPAPLAGAALAPAARDTGSVAPSAEGDLDADPLVSSDAGESMTVAAPEPVESPTPEPVESPTPEPVESAAPAKFGQSLEPGLYEFPDGLRLRVKRVAHCDFDTSVPCYGGTYRAHATLGGQEATIRWSTRSTKVLGYRIDLANLRFTVRK